MMMWDNDRDKLTAQLSPGEELIWYGRPRQGIVFQQIDVFYLGATIVQVGIFWFILNVVPKTDDKTIFWFFGSLLTLSAAYNLGIRFFVDSYLRRKSYYGITSERAILIGGFFSEEVKSIPKSVMKEVSLKTHRNGLGTITFDANAVAKTSIFSNRNAPTPPSFEHIPKPKEVYDLIRSL